MDTKEIKQPKIDLQRLLDAVMEETPSKVEFMGKERSIGWLHNGTIRKFSHIMISDENIMRRSVKLVTVVLLNNIWKIRFFYAFVWRWLYYIKDVGQDDMLRVIDVGKKKVPQEIFYLLTILQTAMMDTMMTMTSKEAKVSQAEQSGEQSTLLEKSTDSSLKEDTESEPTTIGGDTQPPK